MRFQMTAAPATMPVSVKEARDQCRFTSTAEDAVFEEFIAAAVGMLDGPAGTLGRAIVQQTWLLEMPTGWPRCLVLPIEPVISVTVRYVDAGGALVELDASRVDLIRTPSAPTILNFVGSGDLPALGMSDWPLQIEIEAGFGPDPSDVPSPIRTAILMIVAHWHHNREAVSDKSMVEVPMAANALLARWRVLL